MATRIPTAKLVADFSPWTGRQPEDNLNETVIRNGYFDKAPGPNATETTSACSIIWPGLTQKNSVALSMLSTVFASAMEKRQQLGRHTAPSAFKPPPRVTITDSKREAWLRDLANPAVPLRKQARNIPYGIRGKLLMEQCAAKNIPLARAVWLAKCVGANELRAFRRKGVGNGPAAATAAVISGELKWVREWTLHVLQFLESVISTCGQTADWKARMDYAVRLTASFYAERLVEREVLLDWLVTSLHPDDSLSPATSMNRLPIWILLVQLYWKDIILRGRRGRKLAHALLENLRRIEAVTVPATAAMFEPLRTRLKTLITSLGAGRGGSCLIIPRAWPSYHQLLASFPGFRNLVLRNQRLSSPLTKTATNTRCALLKLYTHLDSLPIEPDFVVLLPQYCACLGGDIPLLVRSLLDWTASACRTGLTRIFVTYRFIAMLRRAGLDTDAAILVYLRTERTPEETSMMIKVNVWRVVIELVKDGLFGVGAYLQWILSNGVLNRTRDQSGGEDDLTLATGLLTALSKDVLPTNLAGTHQMLLRRLLQNMSSEAFTIAQPCDIEAALKSHLSQADHQNISIELPPGPARLAIATSIVAQVYNINKVHDNSDEHLWRFLVVCQVLESCLDLRTLGGLLHTLIPSKSISPGFLATIVDTVSLHASAFAALGQLKPLVEALIIRYRTLRASQPLNRTLVIAMVGLLKDLTTDGGSKGQEATRRELHAAHALLLSDFALCEAGGAGSAALTAVAMAAGVSATVQAGLSSASAVCSPASDNLLSVANVNQKAAQARGIEAGQTGAGSAANLAADIDAVFASGNSMDDALMKRVFVRIAACAALKASPESEAIQANSPVEISKTPKNLHQKYILDPPLAQPSKLCNWLLQLRHSNSSTFDSIVNEFVQSHATKPASSEQFLRVANALVVSGCTSLSSLIDRLLQISPPNLPASTTTAAAPLLQTSTDFDANAANIAVKLLVSRENSASTAFPLTVTETYRFRLLSKRYRGAFRSRLLAIIIAATASPEFVGKASPYQYESSSIRDFMLECGSVVMPANASINDAYGVAKERTKIRNMSPLAQKQYSTLLKAILQPKICSSVTTSELVLQPENIVRSASSLSITFSAEFLALLQASMDSADATTAADTALSDGSVSQRIQSAIIDAVRAGSDVWPQLLQCAGTTTARRIYEWAAERTFALVADPGDSTPRDLARMLETLDVAYHEYGPETSEGLTTTVAVMVGKLHELEALLISSRNSPMALDTLQMQQQQRQQHKVRNSLAIISHLSVLYSPSANSNSEIGNGGAVSNDPLAKTATMTSAAGAGTIGTPTNTGDDNDSTSAQHPPILIAYRDLLAALCSLLPRLRNLPNLGSTTPDRCVATAASGSDSPSATTTTEHLLQDLTLRNGAMTTSDIDVKENSDVTLVDPGSIKDTRSDLQESLLDVATFLSDNLPENLLATVPRMLPPIARADPMIRVLLSPDLDNSLNGAGTPATGFAGLVLSVPVPAGGTNSSSGANGNNMSTAFGANSNSGAGISSPLSSNSAASFSFPLNSPAQSQQQQQQIQQMQMQQLQQLTQQQRAMQKMVSPAAKARQSASSGNAGSGSNAGSMQLQQQYQMLQQHQQQQQRNQNFLQSPSTNSGSNNNNNKPPSLTLTRPDAYFSSTNNSNNTPSSPSTASAFPGSSTPTTSSTGNASGQPGTKYLPFTLKTWEIIPPVAGPGMGGTETETSLGLGLFAARRV
jgi:mediator of RNA polymerase II transcription subunit 12